MKSCVITTCHIVHAHDHNRVISVIGVLSTGHVENNKQLVERSFREIRSSDDVCL